MSGSVTVPSGTSTPITQNYSNTFNSALAKSIADALAAASQQTNLFIQTVNGSGSVPSNTVTGSTGELVIEPGTTGAVSVDGSYQYIVDNSAGPDTIFGSPGQSIMAGPGVHTIVDPAAITLSDDAIGNVILTGINDSVAAGNGAATVAATAANEFVLGGGGALFVNVTGSSDSVSGGAGALTANVAGANDTIIGGGGAAFVTLSGSHARVVGTGANLTVLDNGTADTIDAGQSLTSVTAPGGSFIRGGSGPLTFVGGSGPSTIVGATGPSSVFGGTGSTSIIGGPGGATTYVNTMSGGLFYVAGTGGETVDASLSKAPATLFGGQSSASNDLMIGGAGNDLITGGMGSDTLVGGGGANGFYFWNSLGGPTANHVISDFNAIDYVLLGNYGSDAAATAIEGATTTAGSTTITLSDSTKITFTGVTSSAALNGHIISI